MSAGVATAFQKIGSNKHELILESLCHKMLTSANLEPGNLAGCNAAGEHGVSQLFVLGELTVGYGVQTSPELFESRIGIHLVVSRGENEEQRQTIRTYLYV